MLRSVDWELFTDASGQPGGPIFQVQSVTSLGVIYRRFGTTWRSHLPGSISHIFGNYLPTFRDNLAVPSSRFNQSHLQESSSLYCFTLEDGTARFSRNVGNQVSNHATNIPGERICHLHRGRNLKSRTNNTIFQILSLFRNSA